MALPAAVQVDLTANEPCGCGKSGIGSNTSEQDHVGEDAVIALRWRRQPTRQATTTPSRPTGRRRRPLRHNPKESRTEDETTSLNARHRPATRDVAATPSPSATTLCWSSSR